MEKKFKYGIGFEYGLEIELLYENEIISRISMFGQLSDQLVFGFCKVFEKIYPQ